MSRGPLSLVGAAAFALLSVSLTPLVGTVSLSWHDVVQGVQPHADIFWTLRLPRVLLAALAGAALAGGGTVFQAVFRNDLATPYTLGIASGASLGAVLAIHLGLDFVLCGVGALPLAAFTGASLVVTAVFGLVRTSARRMDTSTLLLAGVTLSFLCAAIILLVQFLSDFTNTNRMIRWMMGGLDVVGSTPLAQAGPFVAIGTIWILWRSSILDHLLTGDQLAASRGISVQRERILLLLAASLMVAAVIAFTGPIGFVGLIVPHALRRIAGPRHAWLLPASLLAGAGFLPLCDAAARTIIAPAEIPAGVLTALIGAPFFLAVLLRRR